MPGGCTFSCKCPPWRYGSAGIGYFVREAQDAQGEMAGGMWSVADVGGRDGETAGCAHVGRRRGARAGLSGRRAVPRADAESCAADAKVKQKRDSAPGRLVVDRHLVAGNAAD